jgi:cytochrome c oxidase assembly protein Cox11
MEEKIIKLLEDSSVEIRIRTNIPYLATNTWPKDWIVEISFGDHNNVRFNNENSISQELMNKISYNI